MLHTFHAQAFVENLNLKELAGAYPEGRRTVHELTYGAGGGLAFLYPFGAVVFCDIATDVRDKELQRLHHARPGLTVAQLVKEEFTVREAAQARPDIVDGVLVLDHMSAERAGVIALSIGQSVAMEYYERIVEQMFIDTDRLVDRLEKHGTVPLAIRPLHRFIGTAVSTRSEVLSILHLLDRPDAAWDDAGADQIYSELRAEFDLVDRYQALEQKLRGVQEALELVLDVARDRRLFWLEASVVLMILLELIVSLSHVGH